MAPMLLLLRLKKFLQETYSLIDRFNTQYTSYNNSKKEKIERSFKTMDIIFDEKTSPFSSITLTGTDKIKLWKRQFELVGSTNALLANSCSSNSWWKKIKQGNIKRRKMYPSEENGKERLETVMYKRKSRNGVAKKYPFLLIWFDP